MNSDAYETVKLGGIKATNQFHEPIALEPAMRELIPLLDGSQDLNALRAVARCKFEGYIGLIGSAKKWARFRKELQAEGITRDWLDSVHCPIGVDINANTPAEIGLSIAAEIVREKNA